jgi:NAD-dependent SIR2 family protein deacetylase
MWKNHDAMTLATPEAFEQDPGLVWLFYSYRRHKALQAKPNPGHYAMTELSKKMPGFITLTQNVDGMFSLEGAGRGAVMWQYVSCYSITKSSVLHVNFYPGSLLVSNDHLHLEPSLI